MGPQCTQMSTRCRTEVASGVRGLSASESVRKRFIAMSARKARTQDETVLGSVIQ